MNKEYEVKVTRQALEQMRAILHYISYDLMAPEAAENFFVMYLYFWGKSAKVIEYV